MKTIWLTILIVSVLLLAACGAGPQAITEGTIRDTIFSVEPRQNGSISIWMTHDDVGVYCTFDKGLAAKAMEIIKSDNPNVIITFRSINGGDAEVNTVIPGTGCGDTDVRTQRYKLLTIEQVKTVATGD